MKGRVGVGKNCRVGPSFVTGRVKGEGPRWAFVVLGGKSGIKGHWCVAGASHRSAVIASADLALGSAGKVVQETPMVGLERDLKGV